MLQKKHIFGQLGLPEWYSVLMLFLDLHFTRADAPEVPGAERDDTNWRGRFSHPPAINSRNTCIAYMYKLQMQKKLQIHIVTDTYTNCRGRFSHPPAFNSRSTYRHVIVQISTPTNTHDYKYKYKLKQAL